MILSEFRVLIFRNWFEHSFFHKFWGLSNNTTILLLQNVVVDELFGLLIAEKHLCILFFLILQNQQAFMEIAKNFGIG